MPSLARLFAALAIGTAIHGQARALVIPLQRGEEKTFTVEIANTTRVDAEEAVFEARPIAAPDAYTLEPAESGPCNVRNGVLHDPLRVQLRAGPLPALAKIQCRLRMRRSKDSDGPSYLGFEENPPGNPGIRLGDAAWLFGPVMDVSLQAAQLRPYPAPGEREGIIEITVHNSGPWPVDRVDFGYCQDAATAPFELDNQLPGGCLQASFGPTCLAIGPPSVQFGIGELEPGETKSCLLKAVAHEPLRTAVRFEIGIVDFGYLVGDDIVQDFDRGNDAATLQLSPRSGAADPAAPVPAIGAWGMLLLGLGLTLLVAASRVPIHHSA